MAKRFIDADALIKSAENKKLVIDTAKTTIAEALRIQGKAIREAIENAPTADVEEVVRCKNCNHATFYSCKNDSCYKGIICEYRIGTDDENFYCSYGERKGKE